MLVFNYRGEPHTIKSLSEISGVSPATIRDRLRRGYSVEQSVKMTATNDSVEQFNEASHWEDWLGMPMSNLHEIYYRWCSSHGYSPIGIQGFSRHIVSLNPWLKTVPTRRGNKCYRIIRKRD